MSAVVSRHFVTVDGLDGPRRMHYRRAGEGPAVILLHQSPQSSREYEALMRHWSRHFTLIAPDTPGYGQSQALGADPAEMEQFAAAMLAFADAVGLGRFAVYGYHTGGSLAVAMAHAAPRRITAAAANGLATLTDAERAPILAEYLPRWEPRWDGGHLAWLWARMREQTIFFPWHDRRLAARLRFPVHGPEQLHANVMEFLRAGDAYRVAYHAAFTYRPAPVLPQLEVPLLVTAAAADPLCAHLERLDARADCVKVAGSADPAAALDRTLEHLMAYPGDVPPAAAPFMAPEDGPWAAMLDTAAGQTRLLGDGDRLAGLVIHDAGGSAVTAAPLAAALDAAALDLPGHGEAEQPLPLRTLDDWARPVIDALAALDLPSPVLAGEGVGALLALVVARAAPEAVGRLVLKDPLLLDARARTAWRAEGLPQLAPDWHGGHLSRAWHMVRDARLFFPWFRREPSAMRVSEPRLEEAELMVAVRELLASEGAWQRLMRAALAEEPDAAPSDVRCPLVVCSAADSPMHEAARLWAQGHAGARFVSLTPDGRGWRTDLADAPPSL